MTMLKLRRSKSLFSAAREYHRHHSWNLNRDGILVRHSYADMTPDHLFWWTDTGFIFAKRRVMIWWRHPRMMYQERLDEMAFDQCSAGQPARDWLVRTKPIIRKVGRGRRVKTVGNEVLPMSDDWNCYYDHLHEVEASLAQQDHGLVIKPSIESEVLDWCQGVNLVVPVEIRREDDLRLLRDIVESGLRGNRNALTGYPAYTFADWRADQDILSRQTRSAA